MEKRPANPESSFDGIMTCEELHGNKTYLQFDSTASSLRLRESDIDVKSQAGSKFQTPKFTGQRSALGLYLKTKA